MASGITISISRPSCSSFTGLVSAVSGSILFFLALGFGSATGSVSMFSGSDSGASVSGSTSDRNSSTIDSALSSSYNNSSTIDSAVLDWEPDFFCFLAARS